MFFTLVLTMPLGSRFQGKIEKKTASKERSANTFQKFETLSGNAQLTFCSNPTDESSFHSYILQQINALCELP